MKSSALSHPLTVGAIGRLLVCSFFLLSVFEAAAINVGNIPLVPAVLIQVLIVAWFVVDVAVTPVLPGKKGLRGADFWLLGFAAYSVVTAAVLPIIFHGTRVLEPESGIENGLAQTGTLDLSRGNLAQSVYLLLNAFTFLACARFFKNENDSARRAWLCAGFMVLFFAFYQKLSHLTGLYYPTEILNSNKSYRQLADAVMESYRSSAYRRVNSTYPEASKAGCALGAFFFYFAYIFLKTKKGSAKSALLAALFLGAVLLTTSSVGYLEVVVAIALLTIVTFDTRRPALAALRIAGILAAGAFIFLVLIPELLQLVLLDKAHSGSFESRTEADLFSIKLFLETYMLGVGLGGNRPSSFFAYLLSNVGVVGTLMFAMFVLNVIRRANRYQSIHAGAVQGALVVWIAGKFLGDPDPNSWSFWSTICLLGTFCTAATRSKDFHLVSIRTPSGRLGRRAITVVQNAPLQRRIQ